MMLTLRITNGTHFRLVNRCTLRVFSHIRIKGGCEGAVQLGDVVPLPAHEREALEGGREGLDEGADGRAVLFAEVPQTTEVSVVFTQKEGWVERWKAVYRFALDG